MFSVVILSKNADNLDRCVDSIRSAGETCRVIVVDDGLSRKRPDCVYVEGIKPFIFSRNANIGIREAGRDDVILMNDDATLEAQGGFTAMFYGRPARCGLLSAAIRENVGNQNQMPQGSGGFRKETRTLAFVCVLIPRQVYDYVGALDERFTAYGSEDNDYCLRIGYIGLEMGIFDPCIVGHNGQSTFRTMENNHSMMMEGRRLFKGKWGQPA